MATAALVVAVAAIRETEAEVWVWAMQADLITGPAMVLTLPARDSHVNHERLDIARAALPRRESLCRPRTLAFRRTWLDVSSVGVDPKSPKSGNHLALKSQSRRHRMTRPTSGCSHSWDRNLPTTKPYFYCTRTWRRKRIRGTRQATSRLLSLTRTAMEYLLCKRLPRSRRLNISFMHVPMYYTSSIDPP